MRTKTDSARKENKQLTQKESGEIEFKDQKILDKKSTKTDSEQNGNKKREKVHGQTLTVVFFWVLSLMFSSRPFSVSSFI